MLNIINSLEIYTQKAINDAFPKEAELAQINGKEFQPQLTRANKAEFGDFQINCALSLAKELKRSPREIALEIKNALRRNDSFDEICKSINIAGPGFINIKLTEECLLGEFKLLLNSTKIGIPDNHLDKGDSSSTVIDFSSPNIAKEMHVGHLRSTIIGDSLARILEYRGHKVIRLNHIGDWGTQFGMLITYLKEFAPEALTKKDAVELGDLVNFYKQAKKRFDYDDKFKNESRQEVVKLQSGDQLSLKAWELLCNQSRKEFEEIYKRLDIIIKERGESFYNSLLSTVVEEIDEKGILILDNHAKCVFLDEIKGKDGKPLAVIIQKSDGGFNYATTDLAAIKFRFTPPPNGDGAKRIIYVTDSGQANHFAGVFQIAKRANWVPQDGSIEHVPFGLVQGEDGKKLKTRSGKTVKLKDLLNEAIQKAENNLRSRLKEEKREETEEFIENVATKIGIAAVKYADLSQNRLTNYQFSFERMLALQGNTAPYLLYALVRIAGIARKGGNFMAKQDILNFTQPQEWDLIKELLKFDEVILEVEKELLPNRLCNYLFELSQVFNRFYDQVPILKADKELINCRLMLCKLTAETLKIGLHLLGIPTLERM